MNALKSLYLGSNLKAKRYDYAYRVITHNRHLLHPYLLVDLLDVALKNSNSEA